MVRVLKVSQNGSFADSMKMPCKCHRETPDLLIATGCSSGPLRCTYFSPLKWKHCCPLVTWQCVHLAEDPLKSRIVESLRWTVFSRWEKTTPAASDIAIRWGAAKKLDFRKLHSLFFLSLHGVVRAPVFMLFLSNNGMTTICFRAMAANTLRGDCFWMAPCVT